MKPRTTMMGIAAAVMAALVPLPAVAQPLPDEAGVRAALDRCVAAWNRHVPKIFADACVTDDVWFSEVDDSFYQRFKGRTNMLNLLDYNIHRTDLQWEVVSLQALPDGTVAAQLKERVSVLPRKNGKYARSFDSDPSYARLRREGKQWKLFFFTSHAGWARALLAAPGPLPGERTAMAHPATDPPVPPGAEPPAYMMPLGTYVKSCGSCHGRPPTPSQDKGVGRIVATGAAAADAQTMRRAMAQPRGAVSMESVLADPALTDARLDAIRLWLRALRDGRVERQSDRIVINNPRSKSEPPARLALLRAKGWTLPADGGCREGMLLAGGAHCELRIAPGGKGTLVLRFAPGEGLQPQEVRLLVDGP
ncbi:MAG: hypothetical protein ABJA49_12105 [Betaproteobacteria bacterium]